MECQYPGCQKDAIGAYCPKHRGESLVKRTQTMVVGRYVPQQRLDPALDGYRILAGDVQKP